MNIFVTGKPQTGKTTLLQELVEELNLDAGGIICPEIRNKGKRQGFKIVNLATEEEGILAHVDQEQGPRVSKYRVNMEDLNRITQEAIEQALEEKEVVVIDEIGKMELYSSTFREEIDRALAADNLVLAVLHRCYRDQFEGRGTVFALRQDNFAEVKQAIESKIDS